MQSSSEYTTDDEEGRLASYGLEVGEWLQVEWVIDADTQETIVRLAPVQGCCAHVPRRVATRPPAGRLLDVPVDLLAGAADGVIPPAGVLQHVQHLRAAGVPCSFRILPFGHLDFTFGVKEDIRAFVLTKLRRPL